MRAQPLHSAVTTGSSIVVVPLRTRRRVLAEKMEAALQLPPALSLLVAARQRLAAPGSHTLAAIELATSAVLIVTVLRSLRGHTSRWGVSGVDLVAGVMLLVEWWDALTHGHHWFSPTLLTALVAIAIGVLPLWIPDWKSRRRAMRLDADGVRYRQSAVRRFEVRWRDVRAVVDRGDAIDLECADGVPRRVALSSLVDPDAVRDALLSAATRAGVAVRAPAAPVPA